MCHSLINAFMKKTYNLEILSGCLYHNRWFLHSCGGDKTEQTGVFLLKIMTA